MRVRRYGVPAAVAFCFGLACGGATGRDHDSPAVGTGAAAGQGATGVDSQSGGASGAAQTGGFAGTGGGAETGGFADAGGGAETGGFAGAGAGAAGGGAGTVPRDCSEIEDDYDAALSDARRCYLEISSPQCTTIKETGLRCPCPDVVNERNQDAIASLDLFFDEYVAAGCQEPVFCICQAGTPSPGGYPCTADGFCADPFG